MSTDRQDLFTDHEPLPTPPPAAPTGPRTGTIVWGVVLALLGLGCLAIGYGLRVDLQLSLIVVLAVGGIALLIKALVPTRSVAPGDSSEPQP